MLRKGINVEKTNLLMKKYQSLHIGGQALFLSTQLLKTPVNEKIKIGNSSKEMAQMALFFIKDMLPLHVIMSTNFYRRYHLSLNASTLQKIYPIILLLYPNSADVETLKLPKSLQLLYFPLRPFLWAWRKTRKIV